MADPAEVEVRKGAPKTRVFLRLLRLLRPYWPMLALGLLLLILATPCELFPAIVWRYVTDDVVLGLQTSPRLSRWFSLGGTLHGPFQLLASSIVWLVVIYSLGELLGTTTTWILNRVAQRFMLSF